MVEAERIAATIAQGVHGRRRVGSGESFWQFRRHRAEDPASAIDWRQSAKSQHYFVRENEWEAAESVWIWRDASPSMDYRSDFAPVRKVERATVLALALASLLIRAGERIALMGEPNPPAGGRVALRRIAHHLTAHLSTQGDLPPAANLPRHAKAVLLSDLLAPADELAARVAAMGAKGISGHMIQILDPSEEDLPFEGRTRFEGIKERQVLTIGRVENLRAAYKDRLAAHRDTLSNACRRQGWTFSIHRTDRPANLALLAIYTALGVKHHALQPGIGD
ncbi:MAG: DUF58 domain-containing protein [Alphaproteobacteria bacterium]|nr:DUF58 domain-containing protein [Alphaproteobacteria bacterium]